MNCRWDRTLETYTIDGEECRTDDYGDPTHHCTARRTCANHTGPNEQTCARCIGRTRLTLRKIRDHTPLMLSIALGAGVNSEAANLAGPAADYRIFSARRLLDKHWIHANIPATQQERAIRNLLPDDDELHPYSVTTRWHIMLADDYDHPLPPKLTVAESTAYLERILPRLAQDEGQDFPLFAREIRKVWTHLETVLQNSRQPERGAPCPTCDTPAPRLTREYGHYCDDEGCQQQFHYSLITDPDTGELVPDTAGDRWVCPRNHDHAWSEEDYRRWVADVYDEHRGATA